jgi:hypothetical protein
MVIFESHCEDGQMSSGLDCITKKRNLVLFESVMELIALSSDSDASEHTERPKHIKA